MLDQLCYLVGVGVATYYGLRAVFSVLGWVFLHISPPFERLDLWLKSKAPQTPATPRPEPPLRGYSGYDSRAR
jgi:hypothetical protein